MATVVRDPRLRQRKAEVARAAGRRRLRVLLGVLGLVVAVVGALVVAHSPLFAVRKVIILGAHHESRAEILSVTGLGAAPPLIDVNASVDARAIERLPFVASARVEPHFPSSVTVIVRERVALATVRVGQRVALIDARGRVLALSASAPADLVALSGIGAVPPPGHRLPPSDTAMLRAASALPLSLLGRVASIGLAKNQGVVLHLLDGPLVELGTASALREKMVSLATVLARVSLHGVAKIDLRVPGSPVLTP